MSLAKLTSVSTQTLSLLLERQRLMSMGQPAPNVQTQQILRNLNNLRTGILEFERSPQQGGNRDSKEACRLLRSQFERMRGMLGDDGDAVEPYAFFPMTQLLLLELQFDILRQAISSRGSKTQRALIFNTFPACTQRNPIYSLL